MSNLGQTKPDLHYQRNYLGFIRFQGRIVRVCSNFGSFMTLGNESFRNMPDTFKNNLRTCSIIEPDLKHIAMALFVKHGLNHGASNVETLAAKLIDFLTQLPLLV